MSSNQKAPALGGQNPDYYAETAPLAPAMHGANQPPPSTYHAPPQPPQQQQQYYPPPSTGAAAPYQQPQQPTYAPPPGQGYPQQQQHQSQYAPPPDQTSPPQHQYQQQYAPPPATHPCHDGVPPPKPPRPNQAGSSTHASTSSSSSKPTFGERLLQWSVKAGVPINKVTNKLGSEAFWPSTMDLECDKAARILKSFCKDGFYTTTTSTPDSVHGPKGKQKALVKIPQKAIETAAGLAIFTTFRTGLHISGAGGSGIVVARLPDGQWSPPSGFLVHTLGAGFMIGLDIYDCVCVLRTPEAVRAFTHPRLSLGGEIGLVAGPVGAGTSVEAALGQSTKPVWSYMKSRGLYAGVQADGTVIIGRPDANAAFYGRKGITVDQILRAEVPNNQGDGKMWPAGARHLTEVLKAVEGRKDVNEGLMREVDGGPTPGDLGVGETEREVEIPPPAYEENPKYR